jgi:hypothetical protein
MIILDLLNNLPLTYENSCKYALVFDLHSVDKLQEFQITINTKNKAKPIMVNNNQYILFGDIFSEIHNGGLYSHLYEFFTNNLELNIQIITWDEAVVLVDNGV